MTHAGAPRDAIVLSADDGARAVVQLHGAHVTSWTTPGGGEQLYLSRRAIFDGASPIRGGIPVIFPQFSALGPLPKHGFARTTRWVAATTAPTGPAPFAELMLRPDGAIRAHWPHDIEARLRVQLGPDALDVSLTVQNLGATEVTFTAALHTYLRVDDAATARLEGLAGVSYRDATAGTPGTQAERLLAFAAGVNRIYLDVPGSVVLHDGARTIASAMRGFADVVVWNPGPGGEEALGDVEHGDAARMVCVEAAAIGHPVVLAPGTSWTGQQGLSTRRR